GPLGLGMVAADHGSAPVRTRTVAFRLRVARAMHRQLLRLAPKDVRQRHRAAMTATFDDLAAPAAAAGWSAVVRVLAHELIDQVRARRHAAPASHPPIERTTLMSLLHTLFNVRTVGQSLRALRRRPIFTLTAIFTLALGTAATTALFSVVDTVVVKPLPYPDPDRLVTV